MIRDLNLQEQAIYENIQRIVNNVLEDSKSKEYLMKNIDELIELIVYNELLPLEQLVLTTKPTIETYGSYYKFVTFKIDNNEMRFSIIGNATEIDAQVKRVKKTPYFTNGIVKGMK